MPVRFQVDSDFYDHPKALGLSDAATALWVRAGSYSVAKLLDGFVPENALSLLSRCPEEASGELVHRGLWRRVKGGFRFHEWDHRNLTRARVEADREYDRERKRRERHTKSAGNGEVTGGYGLDISQANEKLSTGGQRLGTTRNGQVNANNVRTGHQPDSEPDSERIPDRSVSVSVSESVSGSGRGARASPTADPEPARHCPTHEQQPTNDPCGPCADARRRHDRWEAAEVQRRVERDRAGAKCRSHRGQPADNCALCRADQLARGTS